MIDPELKIQLDTISQNLAEINKKSGKRGVWRAFFNGMFGALGYIAGLAIVVIILTWFLQKAGLLNAFETQIKNFTDLVDSAKKLINSDQQPSNVNQQPAKGGESTIILPNGQQVKVQIPQQ
jgi:hypothetical protein